MSDSTKSFVYVAALGDSDRPPVRVCRVSGITDRKQIFRKCRIKKKRSILQEYTVEYEGDGLRSRLEVGLSLERTLILRLRKEGWTVLNPPPKLNSYVYVIELDPSVRKHRDVRRNNPGAKAWLLPCLYVGQTRRSPEERFKEHNTGEGLKKGGRHLKGRCIRLRKDLYEFYNPMPLLESLILERDLAEELRLEGYTILGGH